MKQHGFLPILLLALPVLCTVLCSFSGNSGGDVFEIYLNGKQVLQQFVYMDKSAKTLQLQTSGDNDKIEVFYSHCGVMGKNRVLTLRNEKNELIKELKFRDVNNNRSLMGFYRRDVTNNINTGLNLYYSSKELPAGKLLATIHWNEQKVIAKR
ncbi:MAG: hypothetical protein ICV81_08490 [Flavisolibacter sp.]|nr:hypothetical protein [Flavisolibacter sp.]